MKTFPQTTEFVALGGSASTPGFNLKWEATSSTACGVDMGDQYVVIGGVDKTKKDGRRKTVVLYNDDGFVRNLPDVVIGRYHHACAAFKDRNGDMVGLILFYM